MAIKFKCHVVVQSSSNARSLLTQTLKLDFIPPRDLVFAFSDLELNVDNVTYDVIDKNYNIMFEGIQTNPAEFKVVLDTLQDSGWSIISR